MSDFPDDLARDRTSARRTSSIRSAGGGRIQYPNGMIYDRDSRCFVQSATHIEVGISEPEQPRPRAVVLPSPRHTETRTSWPPITYPEESGSSMVGSIDTAQLDDPHPSIIMDDPLGMTDPHARRKNMSNWKAVNPQRPSGKPRLYACGACVLLSFLLFVVMGVTYLMVGPPDGRGAKLALLMGSDRTSNNANNVENLSNGDQEMASAVVANFIQKACAKENLGHPQHYASCEKACFPGKCCYMGGMEDCSQESWCEPYNACSNLMSVVVQEDMGASMPEEAVVVEDGMILTGQIELLCGNSESMLECRRICEPSACCFNGNIQCSKELDGCDPYVYCDVLLDETDFAMLKDTEMDLNTEDNV